MKIRFDKMTIAFKEVIAVNQLTLEIPEGELVCLLGPSGCGKSTTLFALSGLYKTTSGRILFNEHDVSGLPPEKRGIGLVFQNYALYPHMTVEQNIMFPLENKRVPKKEAAQRALNAARLCKIEALLKRKPSQLSGGQQQRVAIARALVKNPTILLLDEPLSNLDARLRIEMREEIRRIQQETKITTVFVTHDQEEAMSISDRLVVMKEGVLQQTASPQEMYRNPANLFVAKFLGNPPINVVKGSVSKNKVTSGGLILCEKKYPDVEDCYIGIRPEGFKIAETEEDLKRSFKVKIDYCEVLGRDTTLHFTINNEHCKAIIISEGNIKSGDIVNLAVRRHSLHIFDGVTEERIDELK